MVAIYIVALRNPRHEPGLALLFTIYTPAPTTKDLVKNIWFICETFSDKEGLRTARLFNKHKEMQLPFSQCLSPTAKPRELKEFLCFLCLLLPLHPMSIFPATGFPSLVQALASEMPRMPQLTSPAAKFPLFSCSLGNRVGVAGGWELAAGGVWRRKPAARKHIPLPQAAEDSCAPNPSSSFPGQDSSCTKQDGYRTASENTPQCCASRLKKIDPF